MPMEESSKTFIQGFIYSFYRIIISIGDLE